MSQPNKSANYTAENIIVLEGLEGVRKRPSMYIGSTSKRGWHHLAFEIIDNGIDEALAGYCSEIILTLEKDNSVRISDNGRGIPVSIHPVKKIPTLEVIFTSLHSGGKFDKKSYQVSGGLHGVGLAVVNSCSEWVKVTVKRDGKKYTEVFGKGKVITPLKEEDLPADFNPNDTGTEVQFYPDITIFPALAEVEDGRYFDYEYLASRLRDLAFLNPIKIVINDLREPQKTEIFHYNDGLIDFVKYLNQAKKGLHPDPLRIQKSKDGVIVDLAFQYNETFNELIQSYVNNINTIEGGTHLTGFKNALTKVFNDYVKDKKEFKIEEKTLKGSDVREGLTAVLSVKVPEPQFEGQTKTKLGNADVMDIVNDIVTEELSHIFDQNPDLAYTIVSKCILAQRARIASQKAREATRRKTPLDGLRLPGKLADCSSKDVSKCEIFIVEGDSAGGSAKQGRSREYQAILPLRGKILNVEKARIGKMFENKEITAMIKAIGAGIQDQEDESNFDITKLRYDKIIIMCDADVDGAHIKTLLLTFFFRFMRRLIDESHVYVAVPPIYKLTYKKDYIYLYEETKLMTELNNFMVQHNVTDATKVKVQRFKGLGEMNPEELWETTMNPDTRRLMRVTYEDFIAADNIFSILMGEEVEPRRNYILDHYHEVVNLDI
jgi:DNA gyrase subunit B